ncbi:MAG: hypothetical protein FWC95_07720 [Defluviitaleaceae bacterium]|nr:hypothetical protein [Defluviitaleaceae bacterium]
MDYKKLNTYLGLGLILTSVAMIIFAFSLLRPGSLGAYILKTQQFISEADRHRNSVESSYTVNFEFTENTPANVPLFIPIYEPISFTYAASLVEVFGIGDEVYICEDGDAAWFVFRGTAGELHVNKFYNRIFAIWSDSHFTDVNHATRSAVRRDEPLNESAATAAAVNHIIGKNLPFEYAESFVSTVDDGFHIVFYSKREGILNRDHTVRVSLDIYGNLLYLDYYHLEYERIASVGIISKRDAFYRLPVLDYENNVQATLRRGVLVYKFVDSILQPMYLFEGYIYENGEAHPFAYYVPASDFN